MRARSLGSESSAALAGRTAALPATVEGPLGRGQSRRGLPLSRVFIPGECPIMRPMTPRQTDLTSIQNGDGGAGHPAAAAD
ncbi:hypothetical protein P3T76_004835 [Phytophthora citrophthora]|uniref:Uncharacterized protein n=1 Tax=Phytophthora citrophthora TaxID=4793 RepID=A0AAD9GQY7_9STRA|nr:hypothetical protein P3T76_004835 [Phytophthora citrophthora]